MSTQTNQRVHCNRCGQKTWHELVSKSSFEGEEELEPDWTVFWTDTFEILKCNGCGDATVRLVRYVNPEHIEVSFFPPRVFRRWPEWAGKLPEAVRSLLFEVYSALASDGRRLAQMGVRATLDVVMVEKVSDVGSFAEKLEALESLGYVGSRQREVLSAVIDAGSATAHRGHLPEPDELVHAMNILENLLQAVYVLPEAAVEIKSRTPKRAKKNESGIGDA